jgi:hypothetical protein
MKIREGRRTIEKACTEDMPACGWLYEKQAIRHCRRQFIHTTPAHFTYNLAMQCRTACISACGILIVKSWYAIRSSMHQTPLLTFSRNVIIPIMS